MAMNRNTVVDYEAMSDERATTDGRPSAQREPRSYLRLALIVIGLEFVLLVADLLVQAAFGATP